MKSFAFGRNFYYIKQSIVLHIKAHSFLYVLSLVFFLFGFITGIFSAMKYASIVAFEDISDGVLLNFLTHATSIFGLFFSRLMGYLFLLILLYTSISIVWLAPFVYLILIYKSFLIAVTISFIIVLCGLGGVLLTLFVLIPVAIITSIAFIILITSCISRTFMCKKYGGFYYCNEAPHFLFNILVICAILLFIACVWELIFLPIFSATIIIII